MMITTIKIRLVLIFGLFVTFTSSYAQITHPGGWFLADDLTLIRTKVAAEEEPWISGWNAIKDIDADTNYKATVSSIITDKNAFSAQGHAAYVLAIKWVASGDIAYANAAKDILDDWVNTVEDFDVWGPTLTLSVSAAHMSNAAEIIAWGFNGEAGWSSTSISNAKTWFQNVVYPYTSTGDLRSMNWGTSCVNGNMSMAVFCDNLTMFNDAIDAYKFGFTDTTDGCAGVTQYIINADGQCFESERDQGHTQGGIAHLVEPALIAWNQGVDIVSYENDRIVAGVEYTAKYNLGNDVSWTNDVPNPCNQTHNWMNNGFISEEDRGDFSPMYYLAAKLFKMAGKEHPYTSAVLEYSNEEGVSYTPELTNTSHPGMGTMCFIIDEHPGDPISGFDSNGLPEFKMNELPMTIEAENFDYLELNGKNVTYYDSTDSNDGGQYRTDEYVDIEVCEEGGYDVNSITDGEWLSYTVSVPGTGTYAMSLRYASQSATGTVQVLFDGQDKTGFVSLPTTGSSQTWNDQVLVDNVTLQQGIQSMKILVGTGGFSINNVTISLVNKLDQTITFDPLPILQDGDDDYTLLGNTSSLLNITYTSSDTSVATVAGGVLQIIGVGISTITASQTGNDIYNAATSTQQVLQVNASGYNIHIEAEDYITQNGIRTENTDDVGGGSNVGHTDNGDWMDYTVDIPVKGTYFMYYRIASKSDGGSFTVSLDDTILDTMAFGATGGWQIWETVGSGASIALQPGIQTIRVNSTSGGWNFNWLQLVLDKEDSLSHKEFENNNDVRIYPNPTSDHLTVLIPVSKFNHYTIQDISGRVKKEATISNDIKKLNIDLNNFSKGIYLILLQGNQGNQVFKLIKN